MNNKALSNAFDKKNWFKTGIFWGVFMFVTMSIIYPLLNKQALVLKHVLIEILIWLAAGIVMSFIMNMFMRVLIKILSKKKQQ